MTKHNFLYILLSILTLGFYHLYIIRLEKNNKKNKLSISTKISFNINKFIEHLGGSKNIVGSEYTHTKVKIYYNHSSQLNIDEIKKTKGITGMLKTSKTITILVGNQAKTISELIIEEINK